jgi:hypothetical protein
MLRTISVVALAPKLGIGIAIAINLCPGFRAWLAVCQKTIGYSLNGQWLEIHCQDSNDGEEPDGGKTKEQKKCSYGLPVSPFTPSPFPFFFKLEKNCKSKITPYICRS